MGSVPGGAVSSHCFPMPYNIWFIYSPSNWELKTIRHPGALWTGDTEVRDTVSVGSDIAVSMQSCDHTAVCDKHHGLVAPRLPDDMWENYQKSVASACELGHRRDNSVYSATVHSPHVFPQERKWKQTKHPWESLWWSWLCPRSGENSLVRQKSSHVCLSIRMPRRAFSS